ncbi:MAG: aminotransferase class I/II-fold pyridoxal phosphate-dependent enzyme [Alphaproteobacteria bacterium]|nr:aminotransferase class I/II-fold pyridoxal phosphate-dependent enzyme [Alphaproteobacteria bacterium]
MDELVEMANWFGWRSPYNPVVVDSLPTPSFRARGREQLSFSTNNYLGIAASPRMKAAAVRGVEIYGVGNSDSRLLGGNLGLYGEVERKLARIVGQDHAILFATGYLANIGALSTLPRAGSVARAFGFQSKRDYAYAYFSDEYNHVSIREGMRLSGARRYSYRHLDLDHLEHLLRRSPENSKIIVTDGVFSQDGDIAPIPEILTLAERYNAMLYVDDSHGAGVLGASGGGLLEHFKVSSERIIYMATLSKAYGTIGGFVAAHGLVTEALRMMSPAYGFTATLPPDQAMVISTAIDIVKDEPERRRRLWENQRYFVERMAKLPFRLVATETAIVPVWLGEDTRTQALAAAIRAEDIHVDAIGFPAVSLKSGRLRIQMNAGHRREDIDRLVDIMQRNPHLAAPARRPAKTRTPLNARRHAVALAPAHADRGVARPYEIAAAADFGGGKFD